jgi:hypothetical protein
MQYTSNIPNNITSQIYDYGEAASALLITTKAFYKNLFCAPE